VSAYLAVIALDYTSCSIIPVTHIALAAMLKTHTGAHRDHLVDFILKDNTLVERQPLSFLKLAFKFPHLTFGACIKVACKYL